MQTGQHPHSFETKVTTTIKIDYLLYLPEGYADTKAKWPLMLFLHGAGERGSDLNKVALHGPPKMIAKEGKRFPFIIASPQCPKDGWWSSALQLAALDALLTELVSHYRIDTDRIYVTGLSMGGFGTWSMAAAYPNRFAAIAPICGGGNQATAKKIAHLPIWVFHGGKDTVVPTARSQEMVDALKKAGSDVRFTIYPEAGHDSWTKSYSNPELYEWLLQHTRTRAKEK